MNSRTRLLAVLPYLLLLVILPLGTKPVKALGTTNIVSDPGFEITTSGAWFTSQAYGNGTVTVHDNTNPHTGSYSSKLTAVNNTLQCPSSECKDTVRAAVEQYIESNTPSPLSNLTNTADSFSVWWYVAPSTLLSYSLHIGLEFSDGSGIEYYYGHSDLTNPRSNLGPIPVIGKWFQMSRNLTDDTLGVVSNPSTTTVTAIWFGAFGGSFMECSSCPVSAHGETAWVDDVSLNFKTENGGPIAVFTPQEIAPLTVRFDAAQSHEPSGASGFITNYDWNFGDGTPIENQSGPVTSHVYSNAGTYTVKLTVIDNSGADSSTSTTIKLNPGGNTLPPLVPIGGAITLLTGLLLIAVRFHRPKPSTAGRRSQHH